LKLRNQTPRETPKVRSTKGEAIPRQSPPNEPPANIGDASKAQLKYRVLTKEFLIIATFILARFKQASDFESLPRSLEILRDVITKWKQ
jgi:hypothetical protein